MLMPQADRKKIYEHLFEDGVCIAKKDYNLKSHPEIKGVKNLYVIKALKVSILIFIAKYCFILQFRVWPRAVLSRNRFVLSYTLQLAYIKYFQLNSDFSVRLASLLLLSESGRHFLFARISRFAR